MSYTILYRAMGIKMSDGTVVPMAETGDNNVRSYNGKRCRGWDNSWSMFRCKLSFTREELASAIDEVINDHIKSNVGKQHSWQDHEVTAEEIKKNFGSWIGITISGKSTYDMSATSFKNWWDKCYTQAVDFDFLNDNNISVMVVHHEKGDDGESHRQYEYAHNEEELITAYNKAKAIDPCAYVSYYSVSDYVYDKVRVKKPKTTPKEKTKCFVVYVSGGSYVYKISSRRLWKTWRIEEAHIYNDKASANKVANKINAGWTYLEASIVEVVKENDNWIQAA